MRREFFEKCYFTFSDKVAEENGIQGFFFWKSQRDFLELIYLSLNLCL